MTREGAEGELLLDLERAGLRSRRPQLSWIWPVIRAWWIRPVADVALENDERNFYVSFAPAAPKEETVFAGEPPEALAGKNLISVEFGREFSRQINRISREGLKGGAGVTLWYAATAVWKQVEPSDSAFHSDPSTPMIDSYCDGRHVASFTARLEASVPCHIATTERVLALSFWGDQSDFTIIAND